MVTMYEIKIHQYEGKNNIGQQKNLIKQRFFF